MQPIHLLSEAHARPPFPATSAKWKHRANYSNDAQRIGQWRNGAEITVGG